MKTVFREILDMTEGIARASRYVAVTLMVMSMEETPAGTLPTDDGLLAGTLGLDLQKWLDIKPRVLSLSSGWRLADARWVNQTLQAHATPKRARHRVSAPAAPRPPKQSVTFNAAKACFEGVDEARRQIWQAINPAANLDFQLHLAAVHLLDHPRRLASMRNFAAFVSNWLKKSKRWGFQQVEPLADPAKESSEAFYRFWGAYHPGRRINFSHAAAVWKRANLDAHADAIMTGLQRWLLSHEWSVNDGERVPAPDRFLQNRQWLDEPAARRSTGLVRDRTGRVITHHHGNVERDYGHNGTF